MKNNNRPLAKFNTQLIFIISLLLVASSIFIRIRLLNVPLERDEGEYAYMAQLLLKGIPPYAYAYTMKLPGVTFIYAFFMSLLGQSTMAIHLGLILVNAVSIYLIYLLGRKFLAKESAATAAAFYALLSLSQSVLGIFAHATHLVVLFSLTGITLLDYALTKQKQVLIFISGLSFGLALLMKQHAALFIPFTLIFHIWPERKGDIRLLLRDCSIFLAAAATPYILIAVWLFNVGVFDRFWFWTFSYAREYAAGLSSHDGLMEFGKVFTPIIRANATIWCLAAAGIILILRDRQAKAARLFLIGYLITACIMVAQGLYFRPHYFIMMLPPAALLAGYATQSAGRILAQHPLHSLIPSLIIITAISCYGYIEKDYLFRLSPDEVSRRIYGANPFPEAPLIASYLTKHTTETDRIAILGSEPEILFHAGRLSATGHIYMYGLMEKHKYAEKMQLQLIHEIESSAPKFIVVIHSAASWLLQPGSLNTVLGWGDSYISLRYDEVGIVDILADRPTRYIGEAEITGYVPESESFVSIYRRRW